MHIYSKKVLREFWEKHNDAEHHLKTWYKEVSRGKWKSPNEIKQDYVKASILKNGRVVFNVCGNRYRLIVEINYERQWCFVRFVGTHTDYDKVNAETI